MNYDFGTLKKKVKDLEEWLKKEQTQIRTGRATPALLDGITVDAYGSPMPLNQLGSLSNEDPRTLRVTLWDLSQLKQAEKAIVAANLGVAVAVDDKGIRVSFPELTSERRQMVIKLAKEKLEQARITLRKIREDVWADIQTKEKEGGMGEDDKFRFKEEMEKHIKDANNILDDLHERKEKEIMA
ncbi:ribosome recycling factor [Candidatus Parcubacteria bacterium]|nr:ribosome recycling factor [Candidatus Parcubacteria bacterium]